MDFGEVLFEIFLRCALSFAASTISCCALCLTLWSVSTSIEISIPFGRNSCCALSLPLWSLSTLVKLKPIWNQNPSRSQNPSQTLGTNPEERSEGDPRKANLRGREENKVNKTNSFTTFQGVILFTVIKTMQKYCAGFFAVFFVLKKICWLLAFPPPFFLKPFGNETKNQSSDSLSNAQSMSNELFLTVASKHPCTPWTIKLSIEVCYAIMVLPPLQIFDGSCIIPPAPLVLSKTVSEYWNDKDWSKKQDGQKIPQQVNFISFIHL